MYSRESSGYDKWLARTLFCIPPCARREMRTMSCRCQTALGLALRVRVSSWCVPLDVVLGVHMISRCFAALDVVLSTFML